MNFKRLVAIVILSACVHTPAQVNHNLQNFLYRELWQVSSTLENGIQERETGQSTGWDLKNIYLRIQAIVGFKIPLVLDLTINPQLEMTWHRVGP